MSSRTQSQQKSYRRQLQLESLERRCMLAHTSFFDFTFAVGNYGAPVFENDIVAVAEPDFETADDVTCGCSTVFVEDAYLPVDSAAIDIDVAPDRLYFEAIDTAIQDGEPQIDGTVVDSTVMENVEEITDLAFTTTVFDEVKRTIDSEAVDVPLESESETTVDVVLDDVPIIYTMSPVEEPTTTSIDDAVGTPPTRPQESSVEEPVIYTFGGGAESSGPATQTTSSDAGQDSPAGPLSARQLARQAKSQNGKQTHSNNLVLALAGSTSESAPTINNSVVVPIPTTAEQRPQPVTIDVTMPLSKAALKQLAGGGRISSRRR